MCVNSEKFVSKLTPAPIPRRPTGGFRTGRYQWTVSVLLLLGSVGGSASADDDLATTPEWQATDDISETAENYLRNKVGAEASNTTVQAGNLDSRHRLAFCSQPLRAFLRRGTRIKARTIVGVRCNGAKPWKVYVPVDVIVTETVFVAKRSLPRGHPLSADDVIAERRDVSRLLAGYIGAIDQLAGQRLKTQLLAGKILTPAMLQIEIDIHRGQTVTLTVGRGQFAIRTSGTALMDGSVNQRIRVKNTQSGRIVEGIVRSREQVEVLLSSNQVEQ